MCGRTTERNLGPSERLLGRDPPGLLGEGILTAGTLFSAETFRYEPPATLTQEQLDQIIERTERVFQRVREQLRDGALASG